MTTRIAESVVRSGYKDTSLPTSGDVGEEARKFDADAVQIPAFAEHESTGEHRWWLGTLATIKATSSQTRGHFALVEVTENVGEAPLHVHHWEDESFWVLEGEVEFEVGGQAFEARPGSFLFAPRDVPHRYTVKKGPARMLFLFTPGGFEHFLRAMSTPAPAARLPTEGEGLMDLESLPEMAKRFGCELLG